MQKTLKIQEHIKITKEELEDLKYEGYAQDNRFCIVPNHIQWQNVCRAICPDLLKHCKKGVSRSLYLLKDRRNWIFDHPSLQNINLNIVVNLHIYVDGQEKGKFKCFGANYDFTELWLHSEEYTSIKGTKKKVYID